MHHHAKPFVDGLHAERSARQALPVDTGELEALIADAARADEAAWASIIKRYGPRVQHVARQKRVSGHDAEDVAQSTWLLLFTNIERVREPAKLGAYVQAIARNVTTRQQLAARREDPFDEEAHEREDGAAAPDGAVLARERQETLAAALERLSERQRRLMLMLADESAPSYADISAELGIPIGAIGPTRARSFAKLRRDPALTALACD